MHTNFIIWTERRGPRFYQATWRVNAICRCGVYGRTEKAAHRAALRRIAEDIKERRAGGNLEEFVEEFIEANKQELRTFEKFLRP